MPEIDLLYKYPKSKRPLEERENNVTDDMRKISRKFDKEYFDGNRMYGYGGYFYNEKFWRDTVKVFYDYYKMNNGYRILDVGCAKGYMIYEFKNLNPNLKLRGVDISKYAIENSKPEIKDLLIEGNANNLPFKDNSFDLIISINTIHNLDLENCKKSLKEFSRVSKNCFITVDAWRNEKEKKRMLQWNLTALTYMHVDDWKFLFKSINFKGDYYWFIP